MSVEHFWYDNEKKIIATKMVGHWAWDEWDKINHLMINEMATQTHPVYHFANYLESHGLPSGSPFAYA
jgi:hypothetical protein